MSLRAKRDTAAATGGICGRSPRATVVGTHVGTAPSNALCWANRA
jgi:hypothetical protein